MKTISLIILALTASTVLGDCPPTWLSLNYGIFYEDDNTNSTEVGLYETCQTVKTSGRSCCTDEMVGGFQAKADAVIAHLEGLASDRDQFILDRREDLFNRRGTLERIKNAFDKLAESTVSNQTLSNLITSARADYGLLATIASNWTQLVNNFTEYRKARATCMNALLEVQSNIWCLVCEIDLDAVPGVDSVTSTLTLSPQFKNTLLGSCYSYIEHSAIQSSILTAYYLRRVLDQLANALEKLADGSSSEFRAVSTAIENIRISDNEVLGPSRKPEGCSSSTSCEWFFEEMFHEGVFSNSTFVRGGPAFRSVSGSSRILKGNSEIENARRLAAGTWEPTAGEINLDIVFSDTPGNIVNEENSAFRYGIIACVSTLVATMLFL